MVVARASGTDLASSLRQNTFLTLGVRPAGVRAGRGDRGGPGTGGHGGARDGGTRGAPGRCAYYLPSERAREIEIWR